MGLLWGRKKKDAAAVKQEDPVSAAQAVVPSGESAEALAFGSETSVFEFGSAGAEKVTLAGYCPVSDKLEPCRWEVFPSGGEAPKFRIIF